MTKEIRQEIVDILDNLAFWDTCPRDYKERIPLLIDELEQVKNNSALPDETTSEPIQNALYATGKFTTDQCDNITDGILQYIKDAGLIIVESNKKEVVTTPPH